MLVNINSQPTKLPEEIYNVMELLGFLKIPTTGTGVAINGNLIIAKNWDSHRLQPDDNIIIINASYGG